MTNFRQLSEDLDVMRRDLDCLIRDFEGAMFDKRAKSAMVRMDSGTLSWDGEHLFVITNRDKKLLLDCSEKLRLEATSVFMELLQKVGLTP
jgi:hypothetical protein